MKQKGLAPKRRGRVDTSTAYELPRDVEYAAKIFDGTIRQGRAYFRMGLPGKTVRSFEKTITHLETFGLPTTQTYDTIATGAGVSALLLFSSYCLMLDDKKRHAVFSPNIYGGSYAQAADYNWKCMRLRCRFVKNPYDPVAWERAITHNTAYGFGETIDNPLGGVLDLAAVAKIFTARGIPFLADNTLPTPLSFKPLLFADFVLHSASKEICGFSNAAGGTLTGPAEPIHFIRSKIVPQIGLTMDADVADRMLAGLATLPIRRRRHSANALELAQYLKGHPAVERVYYAHLEDSPYMPLIKRLDIRSGSCVVSFDIKGGYEAAATFIKHLRHIKHATHLAHFETLATYPWGTTHSAVPEKKRIKMGISPSLIRISAGCEIPDLFDEQIIPAIDRALYRARK